MCKNLSLAISVTLSIFTVGAFIFLTLAANVPSLYRNSIVHHCQFHQPHWTHNTSSSSSSFQLGLEHTPQMHRSQEAYCATPPSFRRSHLATSPSSSSVQPERPLVAKGGTVWARITAGNFA